MSLANRMRGTQERENMKENAGDAGGLSRVNHYTSVKPHRSGSWHAQHLRKIANHNVLTNETTAAKLAATQIELNLKKQAESEKNAKWDKDFKERGMKRNIDNDQFSQNRLTENDEFDKKVTKHTIKTGRRREKKADKRYNRKYKDEYTRYQDKKETEESRYQDSLNALATDRRDRLYDKYEIDSVDNRMENEQRGLMRDKLTEAKENMPGFMKSAMGMNPVSNLISDAVDNALAQKGDNKLVRRESPLDKQIAANKEARESREVMENKKYEADLYKNFTTDSANRTLGKTTGDPVHDQTLTPWLKNDYSGPEQAPGLVPRTAATKPVKFQPYSKDVVEFAAKQVGLTFEDGTGLSQFAGAMEQIKRQNPGIPLSHAANLAKDMLSRAAGGQPGQGGGPAEDPEYVEQAPKEVAEASRNPKDQADAIAGRDAVAGMIRNQEGNKKQIVEYLENYYSEQSIEELINPQHPEFVKKATNAKIANLAGLPEGTGPERLAAAFDKLHGPGAYKNAYKDVLAENEDYKKIFMFRLETIQKDLDRKMYAPVGDKLKHQK